MKGADHLLRPAEEASPGPAHDEGGDHPRPRAMRASGDPLAFYGGGEVVYGGEFFLRADAARSHPRVPRSFDTQGWRCIECTVLGIAVTALALLFLSALALEALSSGMPGLISPRGARRAGGHPVLSAASQALSDSLAQVMWGWTQGGAANLNSTVLNATKQGAGASPALACPVGGPDDCQYYSIGKVLPCGGDIMSKEQLATCFKRRAFRGELIVFAADPPLVPFALNLIHHLEVDRGYAHYLMAGTEPGVCEKVFRIAGPNVGCMYTSIRKHAKEYLSDLTVAQFTKWQLLGAAAAQVRGPLAPPER